MDKYTLRRMTKGEMASPDPCEGASSEKVALAWGLMDAWQLTRWRVESGGWGGGHIHFKRKSHVVRGPMVGGSVEGNQHEDRLQEFWLRVLKEHTLAMWPWPGDLASLPLTFCMWTMKKIIPTYEQHCPIKTSGMISVLSSTVATHCLWPLSTWNLSTETEKLNFIFYLISIHLTLNSHRWPVAASFDSAALKHGFNETRSYMWSTWHKIVLQPPWSSAPQWDPGLISRVSISDANLKLPFEQKSAWFQRGCCQRFPTARDDFLGILPALWWTCQSKIKFTWQPLNSMKYLNFNLNREQEQSQGCRSRAQQMTQKTEEKPA